jgi:hypothetical protein
VCAVKQSYAHGMFPAPVAFKSAVVCLTHTTAGECVREAGQLVSPAPRPGGWSSHYPFTGSAVMLELVPNADNEVTEVRLLWLSALHSTVDTACNCCLRVM